MYTLQQLVYHGSLRATSMWVLLCNRNDVRCPGVHGQGNPGNRRERLHHNLADRYVHTMGHGHMGRLGHHRYVKLVFVEGIF